MSINSPRFPRHYPDRAADCEHAIEREFFAHVVSSGTAYIDLDRVLAAIAEEATGAGWSEQELTDAVLALARRHAMQVREASPTGYGVK